MQVGASSFVTCGTQTDWEQDVDKHLVLEVPKITSVHVASESFLSNESRLDESTDISESDMTWEPSFNEMEFSDSENEDDDEAECDIYASDRKFIVNETCLDMLLDKCSVCNRRASIKKVIKGCLLICTRTCFDCSETVTWSSQPCSGTLSEGHLDLAAAIMFSGSGPTKFLRALKFAGITSFNETTYYNIQKAYLAPATLKVWKEHQQSHIEEVRSRGTALKLGGDGRCCSPGHTAKYGTYSVMDLETGKIIDIQLVQVC